MEMVLLVGNIGSGKSTIAREYAKKGYCVVNMDTITAMIGGGDYTLYDEKKKEVYKDIERAAICAAFNDKFPVVIDRTNMDRERRKRYMLIAKVYGYSVRVHDYGPGDKAVNVANRMKNPRGISQEQWESVFDKFYASYEQPLPEEGFTHIVLEEPYRERVNVRE